jgi:hypothetical protein
MQKMTVRSRFASATALGVLLASLGGAPETSAQVSQLIVTMAAPSSGSLLRGTVTVSANVTIVGSLTVRGVQFQLDGVNLGAEDTTAPYSISWDTTQAGHGAHTLTAVARDVLTVKWTSAPVSVTVDNAPPAVTVNQAAGQADPTNASPVNFTVAFSEPVSGFASGDVVLGGTAGGTRTVTVSGGPTTFNVAVAGMTSGTVVASLAAGAALDAAGNPSTASTGADNVVTFDAVPPAVTLNQAAGQTDPASASPVRFTAVFSEPVADFASGDVTVAGTAGGSRTITVTGGPLTYDVAISGITDGTVIATVAAGAAHDAAGNASSASTSADNTVTFSTAQPTVTRVQDTSAAITYTGGWVPGNTARPWSGGTAALANSGPAADGTPTRATLGFNGTAVSWIGFKGPQTGIARVYLDGTLVATVDTYAATEALEAVLHTSNGLAGGPHTLAIESTGTRNPSSSDILVIVDAFDVTTMSGPDTTPPTVTLTAPAGGATVYGTVTVSANGTDDVGVAGVRFLVNGTAIGSEDASAPYTVDWDTTTVADGPATLTAVARDAAGHTTTSAAVAVTVSNAAPPAPSVTTRYEQTEPAVVYTDGTTAPGQPDKWWYGSRSRGWSGGTAAFNRSAGAQARFTFTGTSVSWIGFRAHWAGIARVSVDGGPFVEIDLFEPPDANDRENGEIDQAVVYTASGLPAGTHTLVVESTGRKHGAPGCDPGADPANCASDDAVVVDAFDVGPAGPPPVSGTRVEETSLTYANAADGTPWTQGDAGHDWSGVTAATSRSAGARATLTFTGTSVSWVGLRGPRQGIARVYLDGALQREVDAFSAAEIQAALFSVIGLAPARHTLTIEATGLRNPAASDSLVAVDAIDVGSRFEDRHPAVAYGPGWTQEDMGKAWSGAAGTTGSGTAALSRTTDEQATFTFDGTGVTWIGYRGPLAGLADVFLDDAFVARVDLYAPAEVLQAPIYTSPNLAAGTHTVRVAVTGEKNPAASLPFVIVDGFDVVLPASAPLVTRIADGDAAVTYTAPADWVRSSRFRYDSGEFATGSQTAGARASLTFRGTSIRWIGRRGFATGLARVRVDGVVVATVDTRVPALSQEEFQAPVYERTGLAAGVDHTIEIEVVGRNGEAAGATVEPVWVDAFDVY